MTRSFWSKFVLGLAVVTGPALIGCDGGEGPPSTTPANPLPPGTEPGGPKDMPKDTPKDKPADAK